MQKTINKPSPYQQEIYRQLQTTNKHIAVEATAGSGKTTTIVQAAKLIPLNKSAIFIAFNKHIVKELTERLPKNVLCSTMHSLGFRIIREHFKPGEITMNDKKQIDFIFPLFEKEKNKRMQWKSIYAVDHFMKLARATMTRNIRSEMDALVVQYALDITEVEISAAMRAMSVQKEYYQDLDRRNCTIDYVAMIELPALMDMKVPKYDYVFIDEAQDMSKLDRLFLNKLVKPITGRKIIVGDKRQAIYSFRGSDLHSFEAFVGEANSIRLPLTVSYRCSKAVVREAQKIYPEIEVCEENEEGEVREGEMKEIQESDMVLCRNTRPLIDVFMKLIEQNKKAYIVGKEMGQGLLNILAPLYPESLTTEVWLQFKDDQKERVIKELTIKGIAKPEKHPKFGAAMEKMEILQLLFTKFEFVYQVEDFIREIFEDKEREGVKLMTGHKAKGLECDRVFFIRKFEHKELIPSQYAVTKDMLIAEENLRFVMTTRAKRDLIYLDL
jgi:DNA helicase-2/ATP-dependent DNA helicase PcrA